MSCFRLLCQMGLACPHHGISDEGDGICIHPYTRGSCPEGELFDMIEDVFECPLVEFGSELHEILSAYHYNRFEFDVFLRIQNKRSDREYRHNIRSEEYSERMAALAFLDYRRLCDALRLDRHDILRGLPHRDGAHSGQFRGPCGHGPVHGLGDHAVACVELGTHYVGFEIEPAYVSVAQRRIDAASLRSRPPQTDLSSFNASADAIQTSSINTRENLS